MSKDLDLYNKAALLAQLNEWWDAKEFPLELTQAQVVLLYKKQG